MVSMLCILSVGAAPALNLAQGGRTAYTVVVPADAPAADQTAALELSALLEQVTGARFPVAAQAAGPAIHVGFSARVRALLPELDPQRMRPDGIVLRSEGGDLVLVGTPPRGTLYAVYTFLEEIVGVRWWTSTEATVPSRPSLTIDALDVTYAPKLRVREAFYRDAQDGVHSAHLKLNGHFHRVPVEYGGHYSILGWCHTFYQLLPPEKYFAAHPDWYSELGGRRTAEGGQLCLTNEAMRAELTKQALAWIEQDPAAGMISISQNDWHGACQCDACRAVVEEEGSESGPILRFVNQVAEAIAQDYPDFLIETLAYSYTRQPPRHVRPRDNVVVRLCTIECSYAQPLETGPQNTKFRDDIAAWSRIAPKLFIWDYVTNFRNSLLPHPNIQVLGPNVRTFANHGAVGLFEQGDAYCAAGDLVRLRAWVLAHLMWDPERDQEALVDEFLHGYYRAAAPYLKQYLAVRRDAVEASGYYLGCYQDNTTGWFDLPRLNRATELMDAAAAAVDGDAECAARVDRDRLSLDLAWIERYDALKREARESGQPFRGPADPKAAVASFLARCEAAGVEQCGEGRPMAPYAELLSRRFRDPGPPPPQSAGLGDDDWVDVQDHRFLLHNPGGWVTLAEDAAASDGFAARMPAGHTQWATQLPIDGDRVAPGRWHVYATVRCEATAETGPALTCGIWDAEANAGLMQETIAIERVRGGYATVDLGVHALTAGCYVWFAPCNNPEAVAAVYIDRVVFVREADR